jgi:hypothetical protein
MNCKKVTQLIPLFVEADLEILEMEQLSAHFAVCNLCSDAMKEFQASQFMLHNFAAPEFNEEVFAQMRSSVLNEIARPQIENLSSTFWNWKVAFAASLAMVILVSGIALNRHGNLENYIAQTANIGEVKTTNFNSSASKNSMNTLPAVRKIPKPRSGRNSIAQGEASISKRNPGNVIENHPSPERAIEIDREENSVAINNSIAVIHETTAVLDEEKLTTEPEMLRIELQTADPNIRIIWFAPKERIVVNTKADMH